MARTNEFDQPIGESVDWSPRERPAPTVLDGRYVRLEPIAATHAESLYAAVAAPEHLDLWTYRPDDPPTDVAETARVIATWAGSTENVTWAIVPEEHEGAQGVVSLFAIKPEHGSVEIAAVLYGPILQRTRAATEAVRLLAAYAFEELGYRRVEWKCDSLNQPSRRAALRLGFTEEGTFRHAMVYKGRNRDTTWFSITDAEWPEVNARLDAWLDPANFDEQGQQRAALARS